MSARIRAGLGAVVIRSQDPQRRLQGLRAALSLALGDRPAVVYLLGDGVGVLDAHGAPPAGEVGENIAGLLESGVEIVVERGRDVGTVADGLARVERGRALERIAAASFQQTF